MNKDRIKKNMEQLSMNPLFKLASIIGKNLKLLMRSKISALIFIFGPLIIISLLGIAFNTSTLQDINIAVFTDSYSDLSSSIIESLSNSQYNVILLESEPDCIDSVKFSEYQACLVFPENMAINNSENNVISIYVDNSRLNLANQISGEINKKVAVESSALSTEMVSDILTTLQTTSTEAAQTQSVISDLLTKNSDLKESLEGISSNLNAIDLTYTELNTTSIEEEISDTATENGLNATEDFSDLMDLINDYQSSYNQLATKIQTASNALTSVSTSIPTITSQVDQEKTKLDEANTNLNTINTEINAIEVTNVNNIINPIKTNIESLSSTNSYLLYILPTILVLLIMFTALLMSSSSIIAEKESRAYFRNFITPTNEFLFMIGEYLSNLIVLLFQVLIIIGVLYYFFSGILDLEIFVLAGISLFFIGTFFIFLGMLFGYMFSTKQTVTLASVSAGMIMLFFSNTILPLETLSQITRNFVMYNPFIISELMLKKVLLFNSTFQGISTMSYTLLGFSAVILLLAILARYGSKNQTNRD